MPENKASKVDTVRDFPNLWGCEKKIDVAVVDEVHQVFFLVYDVTRNKNLSIPDLSQTKNSAVFSCFKYFVL